MKSQQELAVAYSVLAGEEFADVEGDIVARIKKSQSNELDLPPVKPFVFDLLPDSIKLPSLEDRLPGKKAATTKSKTPSTAAAGDAAAAGKSAEPAAGLGGMVKGWLGFGGKKK